MEGSKNGNKVFPFMKLPPELRDMVYEELLEDPYYPPPPPCSKHGASTFGFLIPGRREEEMQCKAKRKSNWILLGNKQIYAEYMDIVVKKATFHLTVSPNNYQPKTPCSPSPSTPSSSTSTSPSPEKGIEVKRIWTISPTTLKQVRKCDIKLITTSDMLGVANPRNMPPASWALARHIQEELKDIENVKELNLHVKALGHPLWNPLWVWYHASQSFKTMGTPSSPSSSESSSAGPKINRITFSLDIMSPGENYLQRSESSSSLDWCWHCTNGHVVATDPAGTETTVREFCTKLYTECRTCRPELESDDEGGFRDDEEEEEEV